MDEDFRFQQLATVDDVEQHLELMRSVFGRDSRVDLQVKKWIDHHPAMTLEDFFVIRHRDRIVAALNMIPSSWSIGGIPLKVAELGCVATLPEYRHRGLQRKLMEELHKRVSKQEFDLVAIEGIPYYYRQFGYEYALPLLEETRIRLDKISDCESRCKIRPFTGDDIPAGIQLLRQAQQRFYVHAIRDEGIWRMQQETGMVAEQRFEGYAVEDDDKRMIAYFRISDSAESKELVLREITDVDLNAARSILSFLRDIGMGRKLETLVSATSYHDPFTGYLVSVGGIKQARPYAWQIRITDLVKILSKMKPLFERRLVSSIFRHSTENVNLNLYRFVIQATVEDGLITSIRRVENDGERNIRINPLVFVQLLLGYRSREELEAVYPDFLVRQSHEHLVDVLFPRLPSYIHTSY